MIKFQQFSGMVTSISDFPIKENDENLGCYRLMSIRDASGNVVNFVISPDTYFVDHVMILIGDVITGFYDGNAPVPLIFPPQYRALIIARNNPFQNVKADHFNDQLISSDNSLKLNIAPCTQIILRNDQPFTRMPTNRDLIVIYGASTKSIPAQTVPFRIIVIC